MSEGKMIRVPERVRAVLRVWAATEGATIGELVEQVLEKDPEYLTVKKYLEKTKSEFRVA